jgi:hypothetical protein
MYSIPLPVPLHSALLSSWHDVGLQLPIFPIAVPLTDADRASLVRDLVVQQAMVVLVHVGVVVITQEDQQLVLVHEVIDPSDLEI